MQVVRVLSDILASQVAAGEVIERPSSVVKELVENSLDAGAKEISVDIEKGGINLIRVTDDGCGMERADAVLSLQRHATSKLRESKDLAEIRTLGFRGEAVPSIASVSKFRMVTRRQEDSTGTELLVDGGVMGEIRDAGGACGTMIEARMLFFNIPARRKFLRAETTEAAHVESEMRLHALSAPEVKFRFRKDGRLVFDYPEVTEPIERVRQLVGNERGAELLHLFAKRQKGIAVHGFVLPAKYARRGRRHQFVFLNGRPIEDAAVTKGLSEGFRGSLQDGLHPAAWLWIDMDPALVDVNVHPAKREVRFHRPYELRDLIRECVLDGLRPPAKQPDSSNRSRELASEREMNQGRILFHGIQGTLPTEEKLAPLDRASKEEQGHGPRPSHGFRIKAMLHERYVILESDEGLVLFDPKAAWERIYFEEICKGSKAGLETQSLLVPVILELDPKEIDIALRGREGLLEAGVEIENFGGNTLQVCSLPACLKLDNPDRFLAEMLEEVLSGSSGGKRFGFDRLAGVVARQAAKWKKPRLNEAEELLNRLFRCDLPYCAADGRPTLTEFSTREIERRLGLGRSS